MTETNRKQALEELREKVKAGTLTQWTDAAKGVGLMPDDRHIHVMSAYNGSTDSAIWFTKKALPEWGWRIQDMGNPAAVIACGDEVIERRSKTPARALLLADLEALIAQEGE